MAFYKKWKFLFPAMIIPAIVYIAWDIYFTQKHVWIFNSYFITGRYFFNLPVEEVLFFFVVPYCCVFIYECVRYYLPRIEKNRYAEYFFLVSAISSGVTGILFIHRYYTGWTFLANGFFMFLFYLTRHRRGNFDITSFLVSYALMLIPFLLVNGLLTSLPVVIYNPSESMGIRIFTIPFEDVFYGMLLIIWNVWIYEKLKNIVK